MPKENQKYNLLVVEDNEAFFQRLKSDLADYFHFAWAPTKEEAIDKMEANAFDAITLDLDLEGTEDFDQGFKDLRTFIRATQGIPVIIITADDRKASRQLAMDKGASSFFLKSIYRIEEWALRIRTTIIKNKPSESANNNTRKLPAPVNAQPKDVDFFITESAEIMRIKKRLKKITSQEEVTVLLLGETGVGKEVAAKYIHENGPRSNKELIITNLAELSKEALESELFGHKKGAFTGAISDKIGYFEKANGSTLFIDEIGEIDEQLQVKLLRFLDTRVIRRMGDTQNISLDIHIILATNKNLEQAVEEDRFRRDFFNRINTFCFSLTPLRERPEDIIPLINFFLIDTKVCPTSYPFYGKTIDAVIDETCKQLFLTYQWSGNVRELRNSLKHALFEAYMEDKMMVDLDTLPEKLKAPLRLPSQYDIRSKNKSEYNTSYILQKNQSEEVTTSTQNGLDINWPLAKQTAYRELQRIEQTLGKASSKDKAAQSLGLKNDQAMRYLVKKKHYVENPELFFNFPELCKAYKLKPTEKIKLFICYLHAETAHFQTLKKHLAVLKKNYPIDVWDDGELIPGEVWNASIEKHLEEAKIYLLMVSPGFFNSVHVEREMKKAIDRHNKGLATVVPIIISDCSWQDSILGELEALPNKGMPISDFKNENKAYVNVVQGIKRVIESYIKN